MSFDIPLSDKLKVLNSTFESKFIIFEPINFESLLDAQLIVDLRSRESDNFLRPSSRDLNTQVAYLSDYFKRNQLNKEIYYKLMDKSKKDYNGLVRLTELNKKNVFNWESLVFSENCSPMAPIDVMISIYKIGFEFLNRSKCGPWDVNKKHKKMMKIHEFCKMFSIENTNDEYHQVSVNKGDYLSQINRFDKLGLGKVNLL